MKQKFIVYGLLLVSIALFSGCKNSSGPDEHVVVREAVEGVTVTEVKKVEATDYYESSGTLKAENTSFVSSMIMGEVKKISVNVGDRVSKGDVMLEIHSPDIEAKLEAARESLLEAEEGLSIAENNRDLAEKTFERFSKLYEGKAITEQEFDEVKTKRDVALLRYKGAQSANKRAAASLNEAEAFRNYMIIKSPLKGTVAEKKIDIGSMAVPGMPLFIVEGDIYRVEASVDERLLSSIKINSPVDIFIDSMNIKIKGRVGEIVRRIDPNTRSFIVKVDVKEASGLLRGGLYARAGIPVGKKQYIVVATGAIVKRGELKAVYTVNSEEVVLLRLIKTGKIMNGMTEVLSGLSEGDRIITDGVEKAIDGGVLK